MGSEVERDYRNDITCTPAGLWTPPEGTTGAAGIPGDWEGEREGIEKGVMHKVACTQFHM